MQITAYMAYDINSLVYTSMKLNETNNIYLFIDLDSVQIHILEYIHKQYIYMREEYLQAKNRTIIRKLINRNRQNYDPSQPVECSLHSLLCSG